MESQILIEVSDNGVGIEENTLNTFDRFTEWIQSRSKKNWGSGLGLSIVKHIVEAHNQTINVKVP